MIWRYFIVEHRYGLHISRLRYKGSQLISYSYDEDALSFDSADEALDLVHKNTSYDEKNDDFHIEMRYVACCG